MSQYKFVVDSPKTSTQELDFTKICRICLNEGVMMSIFKVNVSKKIMACASIQVSTIVTNSLFFLIINPYILLGMAKRWITNTNM